MTTHRSHTIAASAFTAAGLLLAACSSSSTGATHPNAPSASQKSTPIVAFSPTTAAGSASAAPVTSSGTPAPSAHTSSSVSSSVTACELVTETEISTALGTDPGHGSKFTSHGSSQCQYGSYQTKFVLVNLTPTRGRAGYDLMDHDSKRHNASDLSGVGDRALEVSGPGTAGIYFNKGDALVVITVVIHAAGSPPASQAIALAKIAANRL